MPDTGAPWYIPYVAGTDLVADWPTDSQELADAIADGLDAAGLFSQVVQTVKTDTFTTTSGTFTPVTGLTATITPAATGSKVLVIAQVAIGGTNTASTGHFKVTRGGTDIYVGGAASNRVQGVFGGYNFVNNGGNVWSMSVVYLDSPATTSATTYQVECRRGTTGTAYVNRSAADSDNDNNVRGASSITVLEVKP